MDTKLLYTDHIWEAISSHPKYGLGKRELAALKRFLPIVAMNVPQALNVLHLASSTGREVTALVSALPGIRSYLLNDIVPAVVERSWQELQTKHSHMKFNAIVGDIEIPDVVAGMHQALCGPVLLALTGNSVIFANRQMDSNIHEAMEKDDLFLLTLEEPHKQMFASYLISPVFDLLSRSGYKVDAGNVQIWHDSQAGEMHMACGGEDLLVSYKPTSIQLHQRMTSSGFVEVAAVRYCQLHMLAGLYRRGDV